jgi:hypothetical protein
MYVHSLILPKNLDCLNNWEEQVTRQGFHQAVSYSGVARSENRPKM